jgi:CheY-like chemotaxis protein
MDNIRLLIVDDVEDNRLVLRAICRKIEGFEIQEAEDGIEAIEKADSWAPHIILMDIMMPRLDGFQASKVIKERYPEMVIMAVTAVIDPQMEENMAAIGVGTYIRKPIDKELIRFKLQSSASLLRAKEGCYKPLSQKEALNPFNKDIRNFKIIFDITDAEGMMDFGIWILSRCEDRFMNVCSRVDTTIELFYELMRQGIRQSFTVSIITEESFEELYVTLKLPSPINIPANMKEIVCELGNNCIIKENIACIRLGVRTSTTVPPSKKVISETPSVVHVAIEEKAHYVEAVPAIESIPKKIQPQKELRVMEDMDKELLRQSFVHKTTAVEYVRDIGGDVLDEIRDLASLDEEWKDKLSILEEEPSVQNIQSFADGVLGVYVSAINNLFEFTALGYALSALGSFLKENGELIISDHKKLKTMVMLMEHLGADLSSWREHIFGLQDAADIHYLDSSFFSSCVQIEGILGNKAVETDDDDEMEFF